MSSLSFQESLTLATGERHVLLGNGFSIACRKDIFSYNSLYDSADFEAHSQKLRLLFKALKTTDFEIVMRSLEEAIAVLDHYDPQNNKLLLELTNDRDALRKLLVETLTKHHPDSPDEISNHEYENCIRFLSHFKRIYSFNYDLLLYWTSMKLQIKKDDGFRDPFVGESKDYVEEAYVAWINDTHSQNIYYLHGALHLFMSEHELQKFCWSRTGTRLISQIDNALKESKFPLVVAESDTSKKMGKIQRSGYLNHCLRSIANISGSLFIYGHSLAANDDHVIRQIAKNKRIKKVFISLYGDPAEKWNVAIMETGGKLKYYKGGDTGKEIYFYDASSAEVWNKQHE